MHVTEDILSANRYPDRGKEPTRACARRPDPSGAAPGARAPLFLARPPRLALELAGTRN